MFYIQTNYIFQKKKLSKKSDTVLYISQISLMSVIIEDS